MDGLPGTCGDVPAGAPARQPFASSLLRTPVRVRARPHSVAGSGTGTARRRAGTARPLPPCGCNHPLTAWCSGHATRCCRMSGSMRVQGRETARRLVLVTRAPRRQRAHVAMATRPPCAIVPPARRPAGAASHQCDAVAVYIGAANVKVQPGFKPPRGAVLGLRGARIPRPDRRAKRLARNLAVFAMPPARRRPG